MRVSLYPTSVCFEVDTVQQILTKRCWTEQTLVSIVGKADSTIQSISEQASPGFARDIGGFREVLFGRQIIR
jgi:hypothetical protein